ncbi:hypothetical protein [Mesorhizobium sp. B2-3-12]|uniref:hypothetical protein n=1 Tax=Mesorhizobium sp. B2-3-12 TaxID=2589952 RepID=UPI001129E2D2|nr:hypothetical protein [Mesorhizobium sp. B2-3-12]TPL87283.1 hypothetical protein FJ948_22655 [Mesorhizobium sp. B2-3-12]
MATGLSNGTLDGRDAPAVFGVGGFAPASVSLASLLGCGKPSVFGDRTAGFEMESSLAMMVPFMKTANISSAGSIAGAIESSATATAPTPSR